MTCASSTASVAGTPRLLMSSSCRYPYLHLQCKGSASAPAQVHVASGVPALMLSNLLLMSLIVTLACCAMGRQQLCGLPGLLPDTWVLHASACSDC